MFSRGILHQTQQAKINDGLKASKQASKQKDFHPRVTVDQAEGLCHQITLHFGRLNIETGALSYCI